MDLKRCRFLHISAAIIIITFVATGDNCIRKGLCSEVAINVFLDWFSENTVIGFFATSLAYGIATMLLMPGSLLTISAGVAFGAAYDFCKRLECR